MIGVELIGRVAPATEEVLHETKRRLPHFVYADLRLEVTEGKYATAERGAAKSSGDDYSLAAGVRVLAGDRMIAPGYVGVTLGAADADELPRIIREMLETAWRRASVNADMKADARGKFGALGESLADTRLHPVEIRRDAVPAVYEVDPRTMSVGDMVRYTTDVSRELAAVDVRLKFDYVSTLTQGMVWVVAVVEGVSHEVYDALGHQRGWEILTHGVDEPLMRFPTFVDFA